MELEKEVQAERRSLLPFDPIVLIQDALKKWLLILVVSVVCGMVAYVYTDSMYIPVYRTSTTMVLTTRSSSSSVYDNLNSTSNLATVFTEVLNSSVMRNRILDELGMDSYDGSIYATAIESTNLLTLNVSAADPRTAFLVTQALVNNHDIVTYAVMGNIVLEVLEPPEVPTRPANAVDAPNAMKKVTVLVAGGLFFLIMILAYFKDVVRSKREAEQKLDCWCLGEIRHERKHRTVKEFLLRKKRSLLITNPQTGFRYVTTMSKLVRRVEQNMGKGKVLMITSVMENEGKSTVSVNVALALSKKFKRVLLVDCDLHKPACRKIMNYEVPQYHTNDVIQGKATLAEAVKTDKLSRMDMLFAKHCGSQEASDLAASEGMKRLLEEASRMYDFIIIDLPPMAIAPDPEAVMEYADGSLLVIRQNGVRTMDLNRAIQDLNRGKAKMLGCVINNVYSTEVLSGEGYGTGYGRYGGYGKYGRYGRYGRYGKYGVYAQRQAGEAEE